MKLLPDRDVRLQRLVSTAGRTAAILATGFGVLWAISKPPEPSRLWRKRAAWFADLNQLASAIATRYPNLQWSLEHDHLNVSALHKETLRRLKTAKTSAEATRALRHFIWAFHDPHMALLPRQIPSWHDVERTTDLLSRHTDARTSCLTLGYNGAEDDGLPFGFGQRRDTITLQGAAAFPAIVFEAGTHRVGVVRIPSFVDKDYVHTCRDEWEIFRASLMTTCEGRCRENFYRRVEDRVLRDLEIRVRQFKKRGVDLVALDLTGNSGGFEWYAFVGKIVTGLELPPPIVSLSRSRATIAVIESRLREVELAIALCTPSGARRRELEQEHEELMKAQEEAYAPAWCGRVWTAAAPLAFCQMTTRSLAGWTKMSPELNAETRQARAIDPGDVVTRRQPHQFWRGGLLVLINGETASAAELLAGLLKDYAGATLIGTRTMGAGAGWYTGRAPAAKLSSGLELFMPDSVAYRRDGSNFRAGVEPDVPTDWTPGTGTAAMAAKLLRAVASLH